jgi:hypothetical protein
MGPNGAVLPRILIASMNVGNVRYSRMRATENGARGV